ncbi:MAG: hypothetical protein WC511_02470 [Candidatus Pacearchaeota archaeon]
MDNCEILEKTIERFNTCPENELTAILIDLQNLHFSDREKWAALEIGICRGLNNKVEDAIMRHIVTNPSEDDFLLGCLNNLRLVGAHGDNEKSLKEFLRNRLYFLKNNEAMKQGLLLFGSYAEPSDVDFILSFWGKFENSLIADVLCRIGKRGIKIPLIYKEKLQDLFLTLHKFDQKQWTCEFC